MNKPLHLRLTLDVRYNPDGTSEAELTDMLRSIADRAAGEGLMTGETPATVDEWSAKVERVD